MGLKVNLAIEFLLKNAIKCVILNETSDYGTRFGAGMASEIRVQKVNLLTEGQMHISEVKMLNDYSLNRQKELLEPFAKHLIEQKNFEPMLKQGAIAIINDEYMIAVVKEGYVSIYIQTFFDDRIRIETELPTLTLNIPIAEMTRVVDSYSREILSLFGQMGVSFSKERDGYHVISYHVNHSNVFNKASFDYAVRLVAEMAATLFIKFCEEGFIAI
jgi:hypothetical protein